MSPELVTAISSLVTALVIAATAVAAVIQLRHMRSGNLIEAILSFRSMLEDDEHRKANRLLRGGDLARELEDPQFRRFLYRISRKLPMDDVPQRYIDLMEAAVALGNSFELIGGMVRNRVVAPDVFLANYWWVVTNTWGRMKEYIAMMRQYTGAESLFEDFEYLTVVSAEWAKRHPDSYARGVARMPLVNPYPLERQPWLNEP
ncbi:MAG TPA: hypothetical protein VFW34_10705 [Candidatus Rubrimentiphilum sp.]|nr:hypothetical protein [Candidatus Rubrimentiphilum sp.]